MYTPFAKGGNDMIQIVEKDKIDVKGSILVKATL